MPRGGYRNGAGRKKGLSNLLTRELRKKIDAELSKVFVSSSNLREKIRNDEEFVNQDIQDVMDEFNEVFLDLNYAIERINDIAELAKMVYDHYNEYFEDDLKVFFEATDAPIYMDGIDETTAEELR